MRANTTIAEWRERALAAEAQRDELREAAWWVVMNWDTEQTQHLSMPALRKALGLPPAPPTREEARARLDEYVRDPSLWGRNEAPPKPRPGE